MMLMTGGYCRMPAYRRALIKLSTENRALVKWLWVTTHVQKVVGLNPSAVYWMDNWTFFHIDLLLKLYFLLQKIENKQKRGWGWPIF